MRIRSLLIYVLLSATSLAYGQCDAFPILLQKGDRLLETQQPDYQEAINAYTAAIIACPERAQEAQTRIRNMVNSIDGLRVKAERATQEAQQATENAQRATQEVQQALLQVEEEKEKTQIALNQTQQMVDAFYFYGDRFALAYGKVGRHKKFYFIDKNGTQIERLGEWEKAEQFDSRGFAKVNRLYDIQDYILDTLGNLYSVAYNLADMAPNITALDLTGKNLPTLPDSLFLNRQLEVLLLNSNRLKDLSKDIAQLKRLVYLSLTGNYLNDLPLSIGNLEYLTYLSLNDNELSKIPLGIINLKHLTYLDLSANQLNELPLDIGEMEYLSVLDLRYNQLNKLPDNFAQLQRLNTLKLEANSFSDLPDTLLKTDMASSEYILDKLERYSNDSLYVDALHLRQVIQDREFDQDTYFNISWWLVNTHDFEGVIWAGEAYVAGGGTDIGALSNLAMGYLYNGNYEQAITIYTTHKSSIRKRDKRTGQEVFLEDLDITIGVPAKNPADVARARAFLEK